MRFVSILSLLLSAAAFVAGVAVPMLPNVAWSQVQVDAPLPGQAADAVIINMHEAYRKRDSQALSRLLPQARGHVLEPWAAYWELKARLEDAGAGEVHAFLARWAGTYQEDRLRNDWLLLQGRKARWDLFDAEYAHFRMQDDRELRCYAVASDLAQGRLLTREAIAGVLVDWRRQRRIDQGCLYAAQQLYRAGMVPAQQIWDKARLALERGDPTSARAAAAIVAEGAAVQVAALQQGALGYLAKDANARSDTGRQLALLALVRLARQDTDQAAAHLRAGWAERLRPDERNWIWGVVGKWSALNRSSLAVSYFAQVSDINDLSDDLLRWQVRAAIRIGDWGMALRATRAMDDLMADGGAWAYWQSRAQMALAQTDEDRARARSGYERVANQPGERGFYQKLAQEALGRAIAAPPPPPALSDAERAWAQQHPGLRRAVYAIELGLRSEGVREWNYWIGLHTPDGVNERQALAAADLACAHAIWDRCIYSSERTRSFVDFRQRYPTPFRDAVVKRSDAVGLDAAYVYGLIRQESRFVLAARSHAGASGLMQLMPGTARWTAREIGLAGFTPSQTNNLETNILLGTSYLKLALDDFQGSMPMASAAYNAGPRRPASWRIGPVLEGAIWIENIPFWETRDYVKKVLANTTDYAVLLTGQPQSLRQRLGTVGPLPPGMDDPSRELP